tara:strand:+ start:1004 stop:1570 length:567 start_codon:yes stop_codon:yes gene_type:complete
MKIFKFNPQTLEFEQYPYFGKVIKVLGVYTFVFLFTILSLGNMNQEVEYITDVESIFLIDSNNDFSEDKFIDMLDEINLPYPHITLAQAKLETGNFTSKIFNENHNSFGQKEARVRINLARGTQYGHAYYNNWEESILDYAYWYSTYASKCKTEEQFYQLLDRVYAEDPLYATKLKSMVEEEELKSKF